MKSGLKLALTLVLGLTITILTSSAGQAGSKGGGLQTGGYSISGNAVVVIVANPNTLSKTGSVTVEVVLDGTKASSSQNVQVPAGGSATVTVAFPMAVEEVISVGVVDGHDPF